MFKLPRVFQALEIRVFLYFFLRDVRVSRGLLIAGHHSSGSLRAQGSGMTPGSGGAYPVRHGNVSAKVR